MSTTDDAALLSGPDGRVYAVAVITERAGWSRVRHPGCGASIELPGGEADLPDRIAGTMGQHICGSPGWYGSDTRGVTASGQDEVLSCHACSTTWLIRIGSGSIAGEIIRSHRCGDPERQGRFSVDRYRG